MSQPTILFITGGQNSRFFPFNTHTFKGALTLLGRSPIERTIDKLISQGYKDLVIVVSPRDNEESGLRGLLEAKFTQLNIKFVVQTESRGMGDAVLRAKEHLTGSFVISSGYHDTLPEMIEEFQKLGNDAAVTATETKRPWEYGILAVDGDRAVGVVEKPSAEAAPSNLKIQTMYFLNQAFLELLAQLPDEHYSFETALDQLMKRQTVKVLRTECLPTLKYPWHLFEFQHSYFSGLQSHTDASAEVAETAVIDESEGPVVIEAGAKIGHATKIVGPCYIGKEVLVGDFSFVRQSSLEAGVQVGANSEIVRSIVMAGSTIHYGYLADSIVGEDVKISAGLITGNKRLDRQIINVNVKGEKVPTGLNSLGALIGDKANLGIRVSTMPGVCIGSQATVFPGKVLFTNVEPQAVVK